MTEPELTTENIEKALYQLYNDPSTTSKDIAQRWLTKAQRTNQAWQFCWQLLQPEKATEVQYFGVSALISKINGAWNEISDSDIPVLREHLFELILRFSVESNKKIVLTRVCVAFARFLFKCCANKLWPNAISDIIQRLQDNNKQIECDAQRCAALLEILTVIPEEHITSGMEANRKGMVAHMLKSSFHDILAFLNFVHGKMKQLMKERMIRCLSSWVTIGIPLNECDELLLSVADCLTDSDLFEVSVECLNVAFASPLAFSYPQTIKKFVPIILSLQPMLRQAVDDTDGDIILGLTKLICSLAENQTKMILSTIEDPKLGLGLLIAVMECTSVPLQYPTAEFSSPITFTFWYSLQDELQGLPSDESGESHKKLLPFYYQLVTNLLQKASYPCDDSHKQWTADEKEQHRIYRIDISDTLMYVLNMLSLNMLTFIFSRFQQALHHSMQDPSRPWQDIEVCLFGIHSVIEVLSEANAELPCVDLLTQILPQIEVNSVQLADTMLYTVGTLTEWLSEHPNYLQPLVVFVLHYLTKDELTLSSVLTLRRLARECADYMVSYGGDLMKQLTNVLTSGVLRNPEEMSMIQSAGYILSVLPPGQCLEHLTCLLSLKIHQLEAMSKDTPSAPNKNGIIHILDLLSNLFQTLYRKSEEAAANDQAMSCSTSADQPAITILHQLIEIFKDILNRWVNDVDVVQGLCLLYDKTIRSLVGAFAPLVVAVCEMMCTVYVTVPHSCVLDLSQQIVLVFGDEPQYVTCIASFLQSLVHATTRQFRNNSILENPDISHSFLRLMSLVCRKLPHLFKAPTSQPPIDLAELFECGMATLAMPERESAKFAATFFVDLLAVGARHDDVARAVQRSGKRLMAAALRAIGGAAPRTCSAHFADVLHALGQHHAPEYARWLHELKSERDIPCAHIDPLVKERYLSLLASEIKHKRKYRDLIKELGLVCRGMYGTEYAAG